MAEAIVRAEVSEERELAFELGSIEGRDGDDRGGVAVGAGGAHRELGDTQPGRPPVLHEGVGVGLVHDSLPIQRGGDPCDELGFDACAISVDEIPGVVHLDAGSASDRGADVDLGPQVLAGCDGSSG
ncbi:hypothetical protein ACIPY5_20055 [Microbacterium sp. NPDC089698]|uniref:hypothetical protein n=1 Tax=Microbacterium sp. NPDC089698 TaxID=3364200 RepID=UPI00380B99CD